MHQLNDTQMWRQRGEDLLREAESEHLARRSGRATAALGFFVALFVAALTLAGASGPA